MAAAAPGRGAVCGEATGLHVAAGGGLRDRRQLAWSFLLPSLLGALLSLWLVSDLARRLWSPRHSLYALAALFCTLQFGLMAKRAQIDMVLVGMTTVALWA